MSEQRMVKISEITHKRALMAKGEVARDLRVTTLTNLQLYDVLMNEALDARTVPMPDESR